MVRTRTRVALAALAATAVLAPGLATNAVAGPALDGGIVTPMVERNGISYSVHIRNYGWVHDSSGYIGRNLPIEAINFNTRNGVHLCLQAHVQNIGWMDPECAVSGGDDKTVGTVGEVRQIEALRVWSDTHHIDVFGHQSVTGDIPVRTTQRRGHVVMIGSEGQNRGLEQVEMINRLRY